MLINTIEIKNFGIYYGLNTFDLSPSENKNIILISGQNGSGKTTLLNAIKIAIYGPEFLGYQSYNDKYYNFIQNKLNAFAINENQTEFYISINFSLIESGENINYNIKRTWNFKNSKLNEQVLIQKNSKQIKDEKALNFLSYIHSFMPPSLYDMFFFDGEKIERMFFLKNSKEEVTTIFNLLFNIDVFNSLKKDLFKYIKQKNIYSTLDENEKEFTALTETKKILFTKIETESINLNVLNEKILDNKSILAQIENEFKLIGGLKDKDLNEYNQNLNLLESKKEKKSNELKEIINEFLPFIMLKDQLKDLTISILKEKTIKENILINAKINDEHLLNSIISATKLPKETINLMLNHICNYHKLDTHDQLLYNFSSDAEISIQTLGNKIKVLNTNNIQHLQKSINKYTAQTYELRKQIEQNTNQQFMDKMNEIKSLTTIIISDEEKYKLYFDNVNDLNSELADLEDIIEKASIKIKDAKKDKNIFSVVDTINCIIDKYSNSIKNEKLALLEKEITHIFDKLIRKEDFIKHININSLTSDITLINKLDIPMPESNLSAGEKQIYILSILWGMLRVSNRNVPLVFDTLLGRLDESHKESIVTEFLPTIGKQVIILSTDSEMNDKYHDLLMNSINRHYSINFDSSTNKVITKILS